MPNQLQISINKVIKYFSIFAYYPTSKEIYTFLRAKITENSLEKELGKMVREKEILVTGSGIPDRQKNTPPQYSIGKKISNNRYQISKKKLDSWRYQTYIKLVSLFPQIRLVGLSGSISMMNAKEDDDIDLFIITAKSRLFTGRFIALSFAQLFGLRRSRDSETQFLSHESLSLAQEGGAPLESEKIAFSSSQKQTTNYKNKVCLNLFFDESDLIVPKFKQTEFVGHEVLQMKPVVFKGDIYERFLRANRWVESIFPNSGWIISKIKYQRSKTSSKFKSLSFKLGFDILVLIFKLPANLFEKMIGRLQLMLIRRHRTTELISNSQLWFHPDDFEKKILFRRRV